MKKKLILIVLGASAAFFASANMQENWLKNAFEGDVNAQIQQAGLACMGLAMTAALAEGDAQADIIKQLDACIIGNVIPVLHQLAEQDGLILDDQHAREWLSVKLADERNEKQLEKEATAKARKEAKARAEAEAEARRVAWKSLPADDGLVICANAIETSTDAQYCYVKTNDTIQLGLMGFTNAQEATNIVIWSAGSEGSSIDIPTERINNSNGISFVWVDESFIYNLTNESVMQIDVMSGGVKYTKTFNMTTLIEVAKKSGF
ncbi:hypothetical protein AB4564_09765 [Vibrio sp. 10N.222.51.E8]|uniref:hypothetical protein n=1 Tax=unclassified Vibrio TaxID=2614977 RepID=UPI0010BD6DE7|nr:hypothetical protein [Vibrio sp. F13]TKG31698.1 hypothetical protein FCV85_11315 [Vibrio sp. F13]